MSGRKAPGARAAATGVLLVLPWAALAAALTLDSHALPYATSRWLQAEEDLEWCHPLTVGQVLHYRFRASQRMGWSMHYHAPHDAATVLRQDEVRTVEADYRAPLAADYCIRWQNYDLSPLRLEVDFSLR